MLWKSTTPSITVIEDFEGATPLADYTGDTAAFETQTTEVYEGTTALDCVQIAESIITKNGVSLGRGDTPFSCWVFVPAGGEDCGLVFGYQGTGGKDTAGGYLVWVRDGDFYFQHMAPNGGENNLGHSAFTGYVGQWVELRVIEWADSRIRVGVFDSAGTQIDEHQTTDSAFLTYASGRIGFFAEGTNYLDYLTRI